MLSHGTERHPAEAGQAPGQAAAASGGHSTGAVEALSGQPSGGEQQAGGHCQGPWPPGRKYYWPTRPHRQPGRNQQQKRSGHSHPPWPIRSITALSSSPTTRPLRSGRIWSIACPMAKCERLAKRPRNSRCRGHAGKERIQLSGKREILDFEVAEILYFEGSSSRQVLVHTAGGQVVPCRGKLSLSGAGSGSPRAFAHSKSYLVNMAHIRRIKNYLACLDNGEELKTTERNYRQICDSFLNWPADSSNSIMNRRPPGLWGPEANCFSSGKKRKPVLLF